MTWVIPTNKVIKYPCNVNSEIIFSFAGINLTKYSSKFRASLFYNLSSDCDN